MPSLPAIGTAWNFKPGQQLFHPQPQRPTDEGHGLNHTTDSSWSASSSGPAHSTQFQLQQQNVHNHAYLEEQSNYEIMAAAPSGNGATQQASEHPLLSTLPPGADMPKLQARVSELRTALQVSEQACSALRQQVGTVAMGATPEFTHRI